MRYVIVCIGYLLLCLCVHARVPLVELQWAPTSIRGKTAPGDDHYNAAVVEYYPVTNPPTGNETREEAVNLMMQNVAMYSHCLDTLQYQADIVVFPEDGLYGPGFASPESVLPFLEPIPAVDPSGPVINPCANPSDDTPVLGNLSCLARKYKTHVVVNMGDKQPCPSPQQCMSTGWLQYNTDVAFNDQGDLIAKYHKTNLFFEEQFVPGDGAAVTFNTTFGVQFGMMTCFDIMFPRPADSLFPEVTDLVYPAWWVNVPPIMLGTGVQRGYSEMCGINVLAASAGTNWYNSGSGIYQSGETLVSTFNSGTGPVLRMLGASVARSKPSGAAPHRRRDMKNNDTVCGHNSPPEVVVPFSMGSSVETQTLQAQVGDFHCEATVTGQSVGSANATYALVACNGNCSRMFFKCAQMCMVVACDSEDTCGGMTLDAGSAFSGMQVSANFSAGMSAMLLQSGDKGKLLPNDQFVMQYHTMKMAGDIPLQVLGAGLFGRVF